MTVFDNNENLGTQWLALDMLALDIGWLQEEMEAARRLALEALRLEREAAASAKQNPAAVKEWQEARENLAGGCRVPVSAGDLPLKHLGSSTATMIAESPSRASSSRPPAKEPAH